MHDDSQPNDSHTNADASARMPRRYGIVGGPRMPGTPWLLAAALNLGILAYFGYAFVAPASTVKASLLPGKTTHGHYQIELDCNACHDPASGDAEHASDNVMQDACNRCHADQLAQANDTHPARKFNDPTNADLLAVLDAQDCLTCHREHVPDQTRAMGLTLPSDYCWHCHQDVGENRPSHQGMKFDSCATAGCHNYHDNRAIYEKYLDEHFGEADFLDDATVPLRSDLVAWREEHPRSAALTAPEADHPADDSASPATDPTIISDWAATSHAAAGVNCSSCHHGNLGNEWSDAVEMSACRSCHSRQTESFLTGKHGMRLAAEMSPMTPLMARLPMQQLANHREAGHPIDAAHKELTCNACHSGHRFDTQFAAVTACQGCHADAHSLAYASSSHADLWRQELAGELPPGSGVTCATCHLPRLEEDGVVWVNHDQNAVLRPNETMSRQVCGHCHGLDFSLSALADEALIGTCFDGPPSARTKSVQMAHDYFEERRQKRKRRQTK